MEKEISQARLTLYGLIKSFFEAPPDINKINAWEEILRQLKENTGFSSLDLSVTDLLASLKKTSLNEIQDEYYELFENPFSSNKVQLCASFYIDGRLLGQSLVKLRQLLYNLNLGRSKNFTETEDSFVFLLDTMMYLIQKGSADKWFFAQKELFNVYLFPCAKGIAGEIGKLSGFPVYKSVSGFVDSYFLLERCLFP